MSMLDQVPFIHILIAALWALSIGGLCSYVLSISRQITYVTLADGRRKTRKLPLVFRMLLPLSPNLDSFISHPLFEKSRRQADRDLVAAGLEGLLNGREFVALRLLEPLFALPLLYAVIKFAGQYAEKIQQLSALIMLSLIVLIIVKPVLWLKGTKKRRALRIQRSLPFVLDLLTLSVEAGLDFMSAMQRNVERRDIDDLGEELLRVIHEIRLGKSRRVALAEMAGRVQLPDLNSVVNALIQADEMGVSVGSILRIQSEQIRQRRFERAEKMANEAPVKMLGPLFLFIFPAVLLVLLGPIIARMMTQFG